MKRFLFLSPLIFVFVFLYGCKPAKFAVHQKAIQPCYVRTTVSGQDYIWHKGDWIRHGNAYTYVFHKGFWIKVPKNHNCYSAGQQSAGTAWIHRFPHL